jgi:hypothetical protein
MEVAIFEEVRAVMRCHYNFLLVAWVTTSTSAATIPPTNNHDLADMLYSPHLQMLTA